jgi:hypothetical protein
MTSFHLEFGKACIGTVGEVRSTVTNKTDERRDDIYLLVF